MIHVLWNLTETEEVDTWNLLLLSSLCCAQIGNHVAIIVTCRLHLYLGIPELNECHISDSQFDSYKHV